MIEERPWSLLCKVRAFLTKESVPFSTITKFVETPDVEINRLIQHLHLAERENKPWVTIATHDLKSALIQIVTRSMRDILNGS